MKRAVVAGIVLALGVLCHADGKFFADRSVAVPDMPRQRAVLVFRDGVETLILESVVMGGDAELAWVVPVPSEPTEVGFATEGTVATLPTVLEPDVVVPNAITLKMLAFLALCGFIYCLATIGRRRVRPTQFVIEYLLVLVVALIPVAVLFPVFASAGRPSAAIGAWKSANGMETAVVRGDTGDVAQWLKDNGFDVRAPETRAIDAYVKDGWSFVVCRVSAESEEGAPKPLRVTFPTGKAVYPMRLTGVGLDRLHLDLCVVAETPFRAEGLEWFETVEWDAGAPPTKHPRIGELVWDGCFVTRLVGALSDKGLLEDLALEPAGGVGKRKLAAEGTIAAWTLTAIVLGICALPLIVGPVAVKREWGRDAFLKVVLVVPLVAGVLFGSVAMLLVPTVTTASHSQIRERQRSRMAEKFAALWAADIENEDGYRATVEKSSLNGGDVWGKDVPGGVMREGDFVVSFDHEGNPTYHAIKEEADADPER